MFLTRSQSNLHEKMYSRVISVSLSSYWYDNQYR